MKFNILIVIQRLLFLAVLFIFNDLACYSQEVTIVTDTTKANQLNSQSTEKINDKSLKDNSGKHLGNDNKEIKQVKSARPDMSKARGARPPNIERPSGSTIPRGVGKPGGMIKPGKK